MKRINLSIPLLLLTQCHAFADDSEIFPLSDITIGMSSKALLEKHPTEEILVPQRGHDKTLESGIVTYTIPANRFWGSLGVQVIDSKVKSMSYLHFNREMVSKNPERISYDNVVKNVMPLFKQLTQQLGSDFEKRTKRHSSAKEIGQVVYIWKREKDVVAFSHNPISLHKTGDFFAYTLTIAPTFEDLNASSPMTADNVSSNLKLWLDSPDETQ